jgi:hypothetical protein
MEALNRQERWLWRAMRAATLLPFALSLAVHASGVKARPVASDTSRDSLAFEQYLVNLGSPLPRSEYLARFAFRNVGSQPLKISELKPSCGCLNPRLAKKEFAPGEGGEFFLRVRAANEKPGPHEYTCQVIYDDGQPREAEVRFKISLPEERVEIRPRSLIVYQFNNQPTEREITITDFRAAPDDRPLARLELLEATSTLKFVDVALGEAQFDEIGQRQQKVIVTITEVPPGTHDGLIVVRTNVPEYAELRVPLRVDGLSPREREMESEK